MHWVLTIVLRDMRPEAARRRVSARLEARDRRRSHVVTAQQQPHGSEAQHEARWHHLYYGDERGAPGSILTFFEFPSAAPGRAGAGMIHRLRWRVGSDDALGFWAERLPREGVEFDPAGDAHALAFRDPEGLGLELVVVDRGDEPLRAVADGIPPEYALLGFDGVRAYSYASDQDEPWLTEAMGFVVTPPGSYVREGGRHHAS
jgi:glyoxalase family protein